MDRNTPPRLNSLSEWRSLDVSYPRYTGSTTPPSSRRSLDSSRHSSYSSYASSRRNNSTATSDYHSVLANHYSNTSSTSRFSSYPTQRPFTSRFLKHSRIRQVSDSEDDTADENLNASEGQSKTSQNEENANDDGIESTRRKVKYARHPMVLNNGSVIRVRREVSTSEEESSEDDVVSADQEPPHEPTPEPEPEPEDPLDVEERELNSQLQLSFTLTLVDEENIRQRLLEIKKSKLRKNQQNLGDSLVQKFVSDAEVTIFENQQSSAKQEEERILTEKLKSTDLSDVDQKDTQVRLQELFRDRKNVLESCLKNIETTYEHILQETSTELNELENSIKNKQDLVEKLREDILNMTVRRELMAKAMDKINSSHQEKVEGLTATIREIDLKINEFAVLPSPTPETTKGGKKATPKLLSDIEPSDELREIERELECPVCMEIAKPPIYQCEEGHIICCHCKPLLTNCPHNCGKKYSEPAIRCRFAEKLSDKYSAQLSKYFGSGSGATANKKS